MKVSAFALVGLAAAAGFGAGASWGGKSRSDVSRTLDPVAERRSERVESLKPSELRDTRRDPVREAGDASVPPAADGTSGGKASRGEVDARVVELQALRARARAANEQLSAARKRIGKLERELEKQAPPGEARTRHAFDFTADDWREMASKDLIKFRLPCGESIPTEAVLDELGMSPDDGDVLREAFQHSRTRQWSALLPACAAALGGRLDIARSISFEACRSLASGSSQAAAEDAKRGRSLHGGRRAAPR